MVNAVINQALLAVAIVGMVFVVVSYCVVFLVLPQHSPRPEQFYKHPLWLDLPRSVVFGLLSYLPFGAAGFLGFVWYYSFRHDSKAGLFKYSRAMVSVSVALFLAAQALWPLSVYMALTKKIWRGITLSLLGLAAGATLVMLLGVASDDKPPWWLITSSVMLSGVTVIVVFGFWGARYISREVRF